MQSITKTPFGSTIVQAIRRMKNPKLSVAFHVTWENVADGMWYVSCATHSQTPTPGTSSLFKIIGAHS